MRWCWMAGVSVNRVSSWQSWCCPLWLLTPPQRQCSKHQLAHFYTQITYCTSAKYIWLNCYHPGRCSWIPHILKQFSTTLNTYNSLYQCLPLFYLYNFNFYSSWYASYCSWLLSWSWILVILNKTTILILYSNLITLPSDSTNWLQNLSAVSLSLVTSPPF